MTPKALPAFVLCSLSSTCSSGSGTVRTRHVGKRWPVATLLPLTSPSSSIVKVSATLVHEHDIQTPLLVFSLQSVVLLVSTPDVCLVRHLSRWSLQPLPVRTMVFMPSSGSFHQEMEVFNPLLIAIMVSVLPQPSSPISQSESNRTVTGCLVFPWSAVDLYCSFGLLSHWIALNSLPLPFGFSLILLPAIVARLGR